MLYLVRQMPVECIVMERFRVLGYCLDVGKAISVHKGAMHDETVFTAGSSFL